MKKRSIAPKPSPENGAVQVGAYHSEPDAPWGGYINIRLEEAQKSAFFDWYAENAGQAPQILDTLLGDGMKVGLSYDRENECYITTFTGRLVGGSDARYCCTTRGGRLEEVLALACWKHVYVARGDYGNFRPRSGKLDNWG